MEDLKEKTLRLREDLTLVSVEDKAALLDVERKCYYDLNNTAFFLFKLMEGGCLYQDIKAELISKFDVAEVTAQLDLDRFTGELLGLGLVEIIEEAVARESISKPSEGKKGYQPPLLEEEARIAVANAIVVTAGPKWA